MGCIIKMNILDQIVGSVIRPSRDVYSSADLGAKKFLIEGSAGGLLQVQRTDEIILNKYGQKIHVSLYKVAKKTQEEGGKSQNERPTVVYVHANNGSRMEGQHYLRYLFQNLINVVLFDCTGSGLSDGEYITLGMRESDDLHSVMEHIVINKKLTNISLWGRSMGAVTVLLYASYSRRSIKCCIFDSPFANLKRLVKQIGLNKTGLPQFFLNPLISLVQNSVEEKAQCRMFSVNPLQQVKRIISPGLFLTSKVDTLVNSSHVQELYAEFRAKKQLVYISQQHHQPRDRTTIETCIKFILNHSQQSSLKLYQSQYIARESDLHNKVLKTQRNLADLAGDSIKMKQSMMIHSTSQQQLNISNFQYQIQPKILKNQRKSLADKISISAFRKNSLKFKDIKKLSESKVGFGMEEVKEMPPLPEREKMRIQEMKKGVKRMEIPKPS